MLKLNRQQRAAKARTPLQLYVRRLMMEKLEDDPDVVESVIKQLRKLPWEVLYVCCCCWCASYHNIICTKIELNVTWIMYIYR